MPARGHLADVQQVAALPLDHLERREERAAQDGRLRGGGTAVLRQQALSDRGAQGWAQGQRAPTSGLTRP